MLRLWNTRTLASLFGMSEVRTRFVFLFLFLLKKVHFTRCLVYPLTVVHCHTTEFWFAKCFGSKWLNTYVFFYRFVPCGGTTSRTLRVLYLLLTAMTGTELLRPETSYIECWMRYLVCLVWHVMQCFHLHLFFMLDVFIHIDHIVAKRKEGTHTLVVIERSKDLIYQWSWFWGCFKHNIFSASIMAMVVKIEISIKIVRVNKKLKSLGS